MKPTGEHIEVVDGAGRTVRLPVYEGLQTFVMEKVDGDCADDERKKQCGRASKEYWDARREARKAKREDDIQAAVAILSYRTKRGMTQYEMADVLGITQASVSQYERGIDRVPQRIRQFVMEADREDQANPAEGETPRDAA